MPLPGYQDLMLPLLKIASDEQEHNLGEAIEALAVQFSLSDNDRKERLPSGVQPVFDNRVGWARTYLKKAGLLESTARGKFRITRRGLEVIESRPQRIDAKFLRQFPEFVEFQRSSRQKDPEQGKAADIAETPEETLALSYQNLRGTLAADVLERVKNCTPAFFERLVVELLVAMGYGGSLQDAGKAIGRSGDGGIDGIIKEDKLGLDAVFLQAKRWEGSVGRPVVQGFAGSLEGHRARKGVLITTSQFSQDARDYIGRIEKRIVLIDGEMLAELMIDHNVGVSTVASYQVKKVDLDYFSEQ
ncbi:MAG: restriction endonuclease [Candidatus Marsarchaeota archaeon]|nr:restriction endonuclease [Candidatus Marsarchaeota archaeon]